MKPIFQAKPAGLVLIFGAVLWLASGIRIPAATLDTRLALSLDIGPYLLAPAALLLLSGLAGLLARSAVPGSAGLLGLGVVAAGCIAIAGAGLAGSGRGDSALAPGFILLSLGLLILGSRLMTTRQQLGWQALPLLLGLLGLMLPMGAGVDGVPGLATWLVFGLGWLWLGGIVLVEAAQPASQRA